jgi:hypothetical protein
MILIGYDFHKFCSIENKWPNPANAAIDRAQEGQIRYYAENERGLPEDPEREQRLKRKTFAPPYMACDARLLPFAFSVDLHMTLFDQN